MVAYFLTTFLNGDLKISQILPCFEMGKIKLGRNEYSVEEIEKIERIPNELVEEVYQLITDPEIDEREMQKKLKELLELETRPSHGFAFYNDEWGFDIYILYVDKSMRV